MRKHISKSSQTNEKVNAKNWWGTILRLWSYLSSNKKYLLLVLLMVMLSSAFSLLGPFLVGMAIDDFIVSSDPAGFIPLLIGLGLLYFLNSAAIWFQNYWMIGIAQSTVYKLRNELFQHFHKIPISFFDRKQSGELMSRVTNDIENVSTTLNSSLIQIFSSLLILSGTICVMFWLSPLLTFITMLIIPIMFSGMKWITNRTGKLFKQTQSNLGMLNGYIEEIVSGQKIVKTFSQENRVTSEFLEKNNNLKATAYWAQTYSGFIPKLMNVLNNLSFAVIALVGGLFVLNGDITVGVIVIFTEYARQFTRPLNDLANQFNTLLSAVAGAERVFEILDETVEKDSNRAIDIQEVKGDIEFKNVSFSYDQKTPTLENISFKANRGDTIALVGPTGAGKTTIMNIIARFYHYNCGEVYIDDKEITSIKKESLRRQMGFVLQDPFLFQGTILENIRYGRLDASDQEVEEAAKMANAYSFIINLPNGFDTVLDHDGSGISQGQKQLLSIARAILSRPAILLLDEATSSIDTVTEIKIQQALEKLMKGRTCFVIAHRLNTIQNADQILVLKQGEIIEKGTHDSLLKEKGFYFNLYHTQLRNEAIS
ncbi:ATP-binding cassette subfamily B protein [Bacillus pakistanensis]|uniref:ATP-binding cassette subfamily B protein n=1 Tax=Rossellomorea pakistanensis TaxID=992288 RepID=A0ABS2N7L5_9BACI|nr:ABC transporter ATP-binding protein [Bacillus pakistanensis]MBM7583855.1 ATP-binding cassette subfamily B protein [Bacillus pakistanensis]